MLFMARPDMTKNFSIDIKEMMQKIFLKKQAAEIDNLKQETAAIKNLRELTSNFTQQTENDISTIQLLQNRVFSLEAELDGPNAFNRTTSSELSSYLSDMNNA